MALMGALCPLENVRDRLRVPLSAPRRSNAPRIEHFRNFPESTRAGLLGPRG
jgi:hypothetical protein